MHIFAFSCGQLFAILENAKSPQQTGIADMLDTNPNSDIVRVGNLGEIIRRIARNDTNGRGAKQIQCTRRNKRSVQCGIAILHIDDVVDMAINVHVAPTRLHLIKLPIG